MSKIIEKGDIRYKCKCCGCLFEIETSQDIDYEMSDKLFDSGYYYARCPQCSSKVKINNYNM